jgi:hypothetical protein
VGEKLEEEQTAPKSQMHPPKQQKHPETSSPPIKTKGNKKRKRF